jgi:uracil-DNA glycosylase
VTTTVTTRPFLLGEAPSRSGDRYYRFPLSGAVGQRLAEWAGLEPDKSGTRYGRWYWPLNSAFELRNLLERYPGSMPGGGAALPMIPARCAWARLLPDLSGRVVVLLGARLRDMARAPREFGVWGPGVPLRQPGLEEGYGLEDGVSMQVVAIPHPSGLNRSYNDPAQEALASRVLREALARAAGG